MTAPPLMWWMALGVISSWATGLRRHTIQTTTTTAASAPAPAATIGDEAAPRTAAPTQARVRNPASRLPAPRRSTSVTPRPVVVAACSDCSGIGRGWSFRPATRSTDLPALVGPISARRDPWRLRALQAGLRHRLVDQVAVHRLDHTVVDAVARVAIGGHRDEHALLEGLGHVAGALDRRHGVARGAHHHDRPGALAGDRDRRLLLDRPVGAHVAVGGFLAEAGGQLLQLRGDLVRVVRVRGAGVVQAVDGHEALEGVAVGAVGL